MSSACRTSVSCLMLCAYWIALFNPFYAFCEYALNKQYISQSLCENKDTPQLNCEGKCYLAKRIVKAEEAQTRESKPASPTSAFEKELLYLCQVNNTNLGIQNTGKQLPVETRTGLFLRFWADIFHPPRPKPILRHLFSHIV